MGTQKHSAVGKITLTVIVLLGMLLALSGASGRNVTAYAAEGDTVTRAEWLSSLTKTFEMTVEDDNYPDNYFSDLEDTSEYYYDILLAVEFGVVEVEAGDPIFPDLPATREFAAHTLNYCLGFQLDEDAEYTFSDVTAVQYPDDAQVAINREWFVLDGGAFSPNTFITKAEAEAMLADAETVWHSTDLDESHEDSYALKEGIKDLTNETTYLLDDCSLYIVNGKGKLEVEDRIAINLNGVPYVVSVLSVEETGNDVIITGEDVDNEDAYEALDIQGTLDASSIVFGEAPEGVTIEYEEEEGSNSKRDAKKLEGSVNLNKKLKLKASAKIKVGDSVNVGVEAELKNAKIDYAVSLFGESFIIFNSDMDLLATCEADLAKLFKINEFEIIPGVIPGIGGFDLLLELSLQGKCSIKTAGYLTVGFTCSIKNGFRVIKGFTAKSYSTVVRATASAGLKARVGVTNKLLPFKGYFYITGGKKVFVEIEQYASGTPKQCTTFVSYIYSNAGFQISYDIGVVSGKASIDYAIFDKDNSPYYVSHHYEDGKEVPECTRGDSDFKYHTPAKSKHWDSGWSDGSSSTGYDRAGEPVVMWTYTLDDDGKATITGYKGIATYLNIPETIDGHTVIKIGYRAFSNDRNIVAVVIPDSVIEIERGAFSNCTNLTSVDLSNNLKTLGSEAFDSTALRSIYIPKSLNQVYAPSSDNYGPFVKCKKLKVVTFEAGRTTIPARLFYSCYGLESIVIPETVTSIDSYAFYNCTGLKNVTISDSCTFIGYYAFSRCTSLTDVVIPDSVTKIERGAFSNCTNLTSAELSNNLKTLGSEAFEKTGLQSIEIPKSLNQVYATSSNNYGPFVNCEKLKTVTFEAGRTTIPAQLFYSCYGLESIVIPETVTSIDSYAFYNCTGLKNVTISDSCALIGYYAFSRCTSLTDVVIPDSVTKIERGAFSNCTNLTSAELSNNLKTLGSEAFENTGLQSIEIPKSLNQVYAPSSGDSAPFIGCEDLKEVTFEEGRTKIIDSLFWGCYGLETITIPDTVTSIGIKAFFNCRNLKNVSISGICKTIGTNAFYGCSSLVAIEIPNTVTSIGESAFNGCTKMVSCVLPTGINTIAENCFRSCSSLQSIVIPDQVTTIQDAAFYGCTSLSEVTWANVVTINASAFYNCDSLTEVILPQSVKTIGNQAFYGCDLLETVSIPDSVTSFGTNIFYSCDKLKNVTLGTGLTTIPTYTFYECGSLEEIVIPYRVTSINGYAFANDPKLVSVTIPRGVTSIASTAFSYPAKMTIYGIAGTYAETFANDNSIIFVNQEIPATSVTLTPATLTLNKATTATLAMTVDPSNFTDEVSWKSSDTSVATISDTGKVTAKAVGTATIKLIVGNVSTSCKVTVVQPVTGISLNKTSLSMEALDTFQLVATVSPSNAQDKTISWESSDPAVATVDENGLVTALAKGSATITVMAMDGSGIKKTCSVTVTNTAYVCETVDELESPHNYANNCNDFWVYTLEGVTKLMVTFDERTCMEDGFDYLYIYDGEGTQIGKYTGDVLAGQTVQLTGNTVKIKIVSDDSGSDWGFKVIDVSSSCKHYNVATDEAVEPTCTETGLTEGSHCKDCGAVLVKQEVVPALGHELTHINGQAPACEEEGLLEHWKCERCSLLFADEEGRTEIGADDTILPAKGHTPGEAQISDEIPATCTSAGSYVRIVTCTVCGKELEHETVTVPALGHSIGEWETIKPATCGGAGLQEGTCTVCGEKITEEIPATGEHSYTETITKATLTADGVITEVCDVCGDTVTTTISHPATFKLSTTSYTYNGKAKKPTVTVTDANGKSITAANYTVTYTNNTNAGKATAKVTFKGNYSGTKSLTFTIKAKAITPTVTLSATSYTWNGKAKKPTVTVKNGTTTLASSNYSVTYASGRKNVGKYKVTVTMDGNYSGTKTVTFTINPKGTTVKSLTAAAKSITVKWMKQETKMSTARITGYQIQLATDSKFTKNVKTVTVSGYSNVSKKVTSLKGGVKYYVRIRTYKTISGTKYYSPWSAAKTTTTKK